MAKAKKRPVRSAKGRSLWAKPLKSKTKKAKKR